MMSRTYLCVWLFHLEAMTCIMTSLCPHAIVVVWQPHCHDNIINIIHGAWHTYSTLPRLWYKCYTMWLEVILADWRFLEESANISTCQIVYMSLWHAWGLPNRQSKICQMPNLWNPLKFPAIQYCVLCMQVLSTWGIHTYNTVCMLMEWLQGMHDCMFLLCVCAGASLTAATGCSRTTQTRWTSTWRSFSRINWAVQYTYKRLVTIVKTSKQQ